MSEAPTIWENRVRFDETDLHGHVNFGEFFSYMDETFNELLRRIEYGYDRMHAEGWTTNIVHTEMDFRAPAEYGDEIENRMRVASMGERSLTATYEARATGTTLAEGEIVYVAVDYEGEEGAVPIPEEFREAIVDFQDDPPG